MSVEEAKALARRFQVIESSVGLLGCLCVSFAVWAPFWLDSEGLWTMSNSTHPDSDWEGHNIVKGKLAVAFEVMVCIC